jgi:hypothetical protein
MSVSLTYTSTKPVSAATRKAVEKEAARVNGERSWWCEGLIFFTDRKRPKYLTGDTKLFYAFGGYSDDEGGFTEVDADDDNFMGFRDAKFIVGLLCQWSKTFGVEWVLEMADAELGTIAKGVLTPPGLFECDKPDKKANEQRAKRLDKKYASRWDS